MIQNSYYLLINIILIVSILLFITAVITKSRGIIVLLLTLDIIMFSLLYAGTKNVQKSIYYNIETISALNYVLNNNTEIPVQDKNFDDNRVYFINRQTNTFSNKYFDRSQNKSQLNMLIFKLTIMLLLPVFVALLIFTQWNRGYSTLYFIFGLFIMLLVHIKTGIQIDNQIFRVKYGLIVNNVNNAIIPEIYCKDLKTGLNKNFYLYNNKLYEIIQIGNYEIMMPFREK